MRLLLRAIREVSSVTNTKADIYDVLYVPREFFIRMKIP